MKKSTFLQLCTSALAVISLTVTANAKGFTKTNEYTQGKFSDVLENQWYAREVESAYELGFMNGQSDTLFAPEGNVTVAEGITMASRVHSIYNGKTIAEVKGGSWYDMYVAYAEENALIDEGQFSNFDRNIMRYEMAVMFANSMPKEYFAAKNDINAIPDVDKEEPYFEQLLMLYRAGVVLGSDDYGNFYATNPIKRSETAAIINRVALPENRKEGKLLEYGNRQQAVYLISDYAMGRNPRNLNYIASGWTYENLAMTTTAKQDYSTQNLVDSSPEHGTRAYKTVVPQTSGKVGFESVININNSGAHVVFSDSNDKELLRFSVSDGKYVVTGKETKDTGVSFVSGKHSLYIEFDLDNKTALVVLNGKELGIFALSDAENLAKVSYETGKKELVTIVMIETYMYTQYAVNDTFRLANAQDKLYGWTTEGDVKILTRASDCDKNSAVIQDTGAAQKKFNAVDGRFVYETFVLSPANQKASLTLSGDGREAVRVDFADGKITSSGKHIRDFNSTLWNLVRIEGDFDSGKALIRVNGKREGVEVSLGTKTIDTVKIASYGTGKLWFDDVQVYKTYDFTDYCPVPVPVNDDDFYLGMSICSLWREGSHYGWDCISPYDDIQPVLGYYDEGLPEVADWEIKFLAEHGYDFQHFCWYYGNLSDGIKEPRLGFALHDGYMNAKYSDKVKFSIMWENWSSVLTKDDFLNKIWPYWCEWYFTDSRYMTIDNKVLLTIYRHPKFIEHMGGAEAAKEVIEFMREDIKRYGFDGMIILGTSSGSVAENKEADYIGIDGFVAYHFGEASYSSAHQIKSMNTAFDNGYTPFLPSVGVGFNDIGWTETRTPLATVEEHKKVFEWARDEYLPKIAAREGEEWMGKFAIANTWNEFGEGHYIFPTNLNKFGYLDAARQVFSTAAGKDDSKHFDVEPTINQKKRLGYLYQIDSMPLRRTMYIDDSEAISDNEVIKSWNFENEEDCKKWSKLAKTTDTSYDAAEKALTASTLENDSHIKMNQTEDNFFNADEVRYIHIQMKTDVGQNTALEVFFSGETGNGWTAAKQAGTSVGKNGEYIDYYLDMSKNAYWKGIIKAIRLDPMGTPGKFWIKKIELLSDKSKDSFTINAAGVDFVFTRSFTERVGGDIYVGANPSEGFYGTNGFAYTWNRWDGKLDIKTYTGHTFSFTVGSDKVVFDGKEEKLSTDIKVVDGLVMLPIMYIYEKAEYDYTVDGNTVKVNVRGIDVEEILSVRKPYEYEFDVPGDNEGWRVSGASGGAIDGGCMFFEATFGGVRYDSQLVLDKCDLPANKYNRAEIRYKPVYRDDQTDTTVCMYFGTSEESGLNEKKKVYTSLDGLEPDEDGYYTVTLDFSDHEKWTGTVTILRFDPPNRAGEYYVDYIRFLEDPEAAAKAEAERKAKEEAMKAYLAVDGGAPFTVINGDAEDEKFDLDYGTGNATVKVVEDDLIKGNHAFLVTPKNNKGKVWTYFIAKTRYKPGATYRVDFDFRAVSDHYGADAIDVIPSVNFRYNDVESSDHAYPPEPRTRVSTKDGWTHYSCTHTVNLSSTNRDNDFFTIFVDPKDTASGFVNHVYMIDNIKVTCLDAGAVVTPTHDSVTPAEDSVYTIKFDDASKFRAYGIDGLTVDGSFKGTSSTNDPNVVFLEKLNLDASKVKKIRVTARIPVGASAEIFFSTDETPFSGASRFGISSSTDDVAVFEIDTAKNEKWKGTVREIRFDPVVGEGISFEWVSIELCM